MEFFYDPTELLISCCPSKIKLPLSFDTNLAKLDPIFGELNYTYYILYEY